MESDTDPAKDIDGSLYLIRHVFLPPHLPDAEDSTGPRLERLVWDAHKGLEAFCGINEPTAGQSAIAKLGHVAVTNLYDVHDFEAATVGIHGHLLTKLLKGLLKAGKSSSIQHHLVTHR